MEQALSLARSLFESQHIATFIFEPPYGGLERFDGGLRSRFFPHEDYQLISRWILGSENRPPQCPPGSIYLHEDFLHLCAVIVPLPAGRELETAPESPPAGKALTAPARFFVAAPFLLERPTEEEIDTLVSKSTDKGGSANDRALLDFYRALPTAGLSRERFQALLESLFSSLLLPPGGESLAVTYHFFARSQSYLYTAEEADNLAEEDVLAVERRYQIEHAMHQAVGAGDDQSAISFYKQLTHTGLKPRTQDSKSNRKYFLVVLNSHLRKIMEARGVHPVYVDAVSRQFAIQIEESTTNAQLSELPSLMIKTYCQHIREHRVQGYSEPVKKCALYIDFHYGEYLSLSVIADALHINASYLSTQFAKETGQTLTSYINKTRIDHALPLLKEKSRSIESIANDCGFDDMNYFARVFKKVQGVSPSAYRKEHAREL